MRTAEWPSLQPRCVALLLYLSSSHTFTVFQPGLSIDWCKQPDVGLPKPDLVCFLDVSEEVASKRADFGGERYEVTELQRRVRGNYDLLRDQTWVTVSADKSLDEVQEELYSLVIEEVDRDKGALGRLWVREEDGDMEAEVISTASSCQSQTDSD